jgi:hypothetical protein
MVHQRKTSVFRAARILNIKNSTAKAIIRQYRRKGHIFRRKSELSLSNNSSVSEEDGPNATILQQVAEQAPEREGESIQAREQLNCMEWCLKGYANCFSGYILILWIIV